jgi:hypothetical protein
VFPARYELNSYIVFRKRLVSKRLKEMGRGVGTPMEMADDIWFVIDCTALVGSVTGNVKLYLRLLTNGGVCESGCTHQRFLDLGTSWKRMVNRPSRRLDPGQRAPSPRYILDRRLRAPKNRSGRNGKGNILNLNWVRTLTPLQSILQPVAKTDCATTARCLLLVHYHKLAVYMLVYI